MARDLVCTLGYLVNFIENDSKTVHFNELVSHYKIVFINQLRKIQKSALGVEFEVGEDDKINSLAKALSTFDFSASFCNENFRILFERNSTNIVDEKLLKFSVSTLPTAQ